MKLVIMALALALVPRRADADGPQALRVLEGEPVDKQFVDASSRDAAPKLERSGVDGLQENFARQRPRPRGARPVSHLERLVAKGQWNCSKTELRWSTAPALDNDRLRRRTQGRWILLIGDSTIRMPYDYLAGRLSNEWGREWPRGIGNHGPQRDNDHTWKNGACAGEFSGCVYDSWVAGTRLTFVWEPGGASNGTLDAVSALVKGTVGGPDAVLVSLGTHGQAPFGDEHLFFLRSLEGLFQPRNATWPPWPSTPRLIYCALTQCRNANDAPDLSALVRSTEAPYEEVLCSSGHNSSSCASRNVQLDLGGIAFARGRWKWGWEIMDRTYLTLPPTVERCQALFDCGPLGILHPAGNVLAGMIDVFAASFHDK